MKSFFKMVLASVVGLLIASLLFFFITIGIIAAIVSSEDGVAEVKPNTILKLKLDNQIVERSEKNPFEGLDFNGFGSPKQDGLAEIVENLNKAKDDPNIKGVYLELSIIPSRLGSIQEIRSALADFKQSGKFVVVYSDYMGQSAYYLATVADKIYLNPQGSIDFMGARAELMFLKGTLDKLGIEAQIIRHGKFKSAVEPLTEQKMSPENRAQMTALISSMWKNILSDISVSRKISTDKLNLMANNMLLSSADSCFTNHMVDSLLYKDQMDSVLLKLSGNTGKKPEFVSNSKYQKVPKQASGKGIAKDKIAIVYAYGDVIMGDEGEGTVSCERISQAIRDARTDSTVKAIVFRVNSPGGSALASEVIWREVVLAKKAKPLVVSMGSLAASGGYWISCPADTIVAQPTTITGSIGVFGVVLNIKQLLNQKLGITTDVAKTNAHSDFPTISRPMDAQEKLVFQREVDGIYTTFTKHVSEGRKMDVKKVDEIGQGRVWTGEDAVKIGLVDTLGYLNDAIKIAARMAKVDHYRITNLPKLEDPIDKILKEISGDVKVNMIKSELGENYKYVEMIKKLEQMKGVQARLPFEVEIY
jgi:protease IV